MSLPTKQAAAESEQWLAENVLGPAFLEKLATVHGIRPRSKAETSQLLQLGAVLADRARAGQYKTAAQQQEEAPNPFLAHALAALGEQPGMATQHQDAYIKQASAELVRSNQLALSAALIYDHVLRGGELAEPAAAAN